MRSAFNFFFYDLAVLLHHRQCIVHGLKHGCRGCCLMAAVPQLGNQTGLAFNPFESGRDGGVCPSQMLKLYVAMHRVVQPRPVSDTQLMECIINGPQQGCGDVRFLQKGPILVTRWNHSRGMAGQDDKRNLAFG